MQKIIDGITYELQDFGRGRKVAYILKALPLENPEKKIEIPPNVEGYAVVGVCPRAFRNVNNNWIQEISFSSGIQFLRSQAFSELGNLKTVNFNARQKTPFFDFYCFENCKNLELLFFADHEKFGESYVVRYQEGCYNAKEKSIISSILRKSNRRAFRGCWKLPTELAEH